MERLPDSVVFQRGPGSHGPVVVELPVEGSLGEGTPASPVLHGGGYGHGLLDLAQVEGFFKRGGEPEIPGHGGGDNAVAPFVFLVMFHHGAGDVPLVRGGVGFYQPRGGE